MSLLLLHTSQLFPHRGFSRRRSLFFFLSWRLLKGTTLFCVLLAFFWSSSSTSLSPSYFSFVSYVPLLWLPCSLSFYFCCFFIIFMSLFLLLFLASTSNYYTPTSNGFPANEMSSYQPTLQTANAYQSPLPKKTAMTRPTASSAARWDWLLFPPDSYPECYTPSPTFVASPPPSELSDTDLVACLPTCLLALLCLTPSLIPPSNEENEGDPEIRSLGVPTETDPSTKVNRSSTPDTDDGYQSASDASRSDYSHASSSSSLSIPVDQLISQHDATNNEHRSLTSAHSTRLSYAAATKPTLLAPTNTNKLSSAMNKGKQTNKNPLSTIVDINESLTTSGQKLKFTAPRFERMHHAKQHSSATTMSTTAMKSSLISPTNRTSTRSNNNQRSHVVHSTRRRWTQPLTFGHSVDIHLWRVFSLLFVCL